MDREIVVQLIGGLGVLASVIAFQCKNHKKILFFRMLNEFVFAIQYILLGAYTGAVADVIGCVRNLVFTRQISREKKTTIPIIVFSVIFFVFGCVTWDGPKSLLVIAAKVLSTMAYGSKNTTVLRGIIFVTSSCWLIYNSFVFSIAGILCEVFTLTSLIIGVIRLDIIPALSKKAKNNA